MRRLIKWTDRNFNLMFNYESCIKFQLEIDLMYNALYYDGKNSYRYLGKNWFILINTKNK